MTNQVIIPPRSGWEPQSYYLVEAAFHKSNPINGYVFYTGFIDHDGRPGGYNEFAGTGRLTITNCVFLRAIRLLETKDSMETLPNYLKLPTDPDVDDTSYMI